MDNTEPDYIREVLGEDYEALQQDTMTRLFIGIPISESVSEGLSTVLREQFPQYVEKEVPRENLHMTLFFLGEVKNHLQYVGRLKESLNLSFVPTVSVTYMGRGKQRDQLWAYINPTSNLTMLRDSIRERLGSIRFPTPNDSYPFTPHIRLASFYPMARSLGIADVRVSESFSVREIYLYKSELGSDGATYSVEATIPL